jgi:hypothetical protein
LKGSVFYKIIIYKIINNYSFKIISKKIKINLIALFRFTLVMQTENQSQTMDNLPVPPPRTITYPISPNWRFTGSDAQMLSSAYNVRVMEHIANYGFENFVKTRRSQR